MAKVQRFPFVEVNERLGAASSLPYLPMALTYRGTTLPASGILDTGATVNVLHLAVGQQLGAVWAQQNVPVRLTGNLARLEARALVVTATVAPFAPVRLAFAWTRADNVPLILGQVSFFLEFNVCFFRSQQVFEVRPKE